MAKKKSTAASPPAGMVAPVHRPAPAVDADAQRSAQIAELDKKLAEALVLLEQIRDAVRDRDT